MESVKGSLAMKIIGWLITIVGFVFLFIKAFGNMTGFVISESVNLLPDYSYLGGFLAVIVGVVLLMSTGRRN